MSLTNIIQGISKDWITYRKFCEEVSKSGAEPLEKKDHHVHELVNVKWKEEISKKVNLKKYLLTHPQEKET